MHIAILEDDLEQAEFIRLWLSSVQQTADIYPCGTDFKQGVLSSYYDLCIIDWELPDINGDEILEWIRNEWKSNVLVLFATARNQEEDIIKILHLGADDYMVKPISPPEMLARVAALGRRIRTSPTTKKNITEHNISLDLEGHTAIVGGEVCNLTPKEFELAVYLLKNIGSLVRRETLLKSVWNMNADIDTRTVDTHISRLRKKLGLEPTKGWNLNVVYQYGYRLDKVESTSPL